jgi:hypothetical protein
MNKILWKLPVPATAIVRGPFFNVLPKRQCEISFSLETESGEDEMTSIVFVGVESFKCTFLASLGSIDNQLLRESYGTLISLEESQWMTEVGECCSKYYSLSLKQPKIVQHMMISFDDGPCYEIICEDFKKSSTT